VMPTECLFFFDIFQCPEAMTIKRIKTKSSRKTSVQPKAKKRSASHSPVDGDSIPKKASIESPQTSETPLKTGRAFTFEVRAKDYNAAIEHEVNHVLEPRKPTGMLELFLRNCPAGITDNDIKKYYSSLGQGAITRIKWMRHPNGEFKHIGYVQFATEELARQALQLPAPTIKARRLSVQLNPVIDDKREVTPNVVEISGAPPGSDEQIKEWAKPCGPGAVVKIKWLQYKDGTPRRLALVQFFSANMALMAGKLKPPCLEGHECGVKVYPDRLTPYSPTEVALSHCPDGLDDQHILNYYMWLGAGAVEKVSWLDGRKEGPHRVAFVRFKDESMCALALQLPAPAISGRAARIALAPRCGGPPLPNHLTASEGSGGWTAKSAASPEHGKGGPAPHQHKHFPQ
jgi:hypothetical protein